MPEHDANVIAIPVRSLRFLVVDDDDDQRYLLVRTLNRLGMANVVEAASGRAALDVLGDDGASVDIVFADLNMPDIDGMELVRRIGERKLRVSMALVSALDLGLLESAARMTRAYGVDMLGTVEKPVTRDKVFALLAQYHAQGGPPELVSAIGFEPSADDVLHGFSAGQFEPHFQAVVDIATGNVVGAEALARWQHPTRGVLGPEVFLPPLARSGRLDDLSWIMLALSAMEAGRWRDAGLDLKASVNVSATSLADPAYSESVIEIVSAHGVSPSQMVLELTETEAILDVAAAFENVTRLRMSGFGLAIDDYGVGYSSMQELARMPFTELKIDRSFVVAAASDERARLMIVHTVAIARRLGLTTVAEGVESTRERDLVACLGCDRIQGYFVAKPMDGVDFMRWIQERAINVVASTPPGPAQRRFGT